jgi:hypothetical protein
VTKGRLIVLGLVVLFAVWIYALTSGKTSHQPAQASVSFSPAPPVKLAGCQPHIEVHNAAHWAKELGTSEASVQATHRINLWSTPSGPKRAVGHLLVGSRAAIVNETADAYQVQSPADGTVGWISKIQVARVLRQDVETRTPCK